MTSQRPTLHQVNIVSGDLVASLTFYRRLGVEIPENGVWQTPSGIHHANVGAAGEGPLNLD